MHGAGVRVIAVFKLLKAVLLLAVGVGALKLVDRDVAHVLGRWAAQLHLDPDGHLVRGALERFANLDPRRITAISAGMFVYAGLMLTEGVGLWLRKRWAEYLTVIATALLVPLEIYEIARRTTPIRIGALVVNVAIVGYLIARLRHRAPVRRR